MSNNGEIPSLHDLYVSPGHESFPYPRDVDKCHEILRKYYRIMESLRAECVRLSALVRDDYRRLESGTSDDD